MANIKKSTEREERSLNPVLRFVSKIDGWMMKHAKGRCAFRIVREDHFCEKRV